MAAIQHEVWIDAPRKLVYKLLATPEGMSSWWDKQTAVVDDGSEVWEHTPGPEHGTVRMLILDKQENKLFKWKCISSHKNNVPASAWTNTIISFELGDRDSSAVASEPWATTFPLQTILKFTHEGWEQTSRYLPFCNTSWAGVLQKLAEKAQRADREK